MSRRVACFNQMSGISALRALVYAIRGWEIRYFDQTRLGRALTSALAALPGRRFSFTRAEYQVGDYKGLYAEATRTAFDITEEWFREADVAQSQRWFGLFGQPERARAYIKKATLLAIQRLLRRVLVFERLTRDLDGDAQFVIEGSSAVGWQLSQFCRMTGRSPEMLVCLSLPARIEVVLDLVSYYLSLCLFTIRRGLSVRSVRHDYLLAKRAIWPMGRRRGDDFLVDGQTVLPSDLLLYYGDTSKLETEEAVHAARRAGYSPVDFDGAPVRLRWLTSRKTITTYLVGPVLQAWGCLLPGAGRHAGGLARLMFRMRRHVLSWDVFFDRYNVRCLVSDSLGRENQVAMTIAVHSHGGITAAAQATENSDESNEMLYYLTWHYLFTWGQGVAGIWQDTWCVDEVVPVGYLWGQLHQESLRERQSIRARHGVTEDAALVTVFDSSVGKDAFNSRSSLQRFYETATMLATRLEGATVVLKPKSMGVPLADLVPERDGASGSRLIVGDPVYTDANELIAASDLVVNMAQSSTIVEALVSGVPAMALDETGRDWSRVLAHPERLVFDNAGDLCEAAARILGEGIDTATWNEIRDCIRWNYGDVGGQAIDLLRTHILDACGRRPTAKVAVTEGETAAPRP